MSLPSPSGLIPLASADASPPLDPPAVTSGFHGLRVRPRSCESVCTRSPKSGRLVLANGIAPAARMRSTIGASTDAMACSSAVTPCVVADPADVDVLLDRDRHAVQRADVAAAGDGSIGVVGRGDGLGEEGDDGVEVAVDGVDASEQGVEDLAAASPPACGSAPPVRGPTVARARSSAHHDPPMRPWLLGARPRTLPAAVVPVAIGAACAVGEGSVTWWRVGVGPRRQPRSAGRRQLRQRLQRRRPRDRRCTRRARCASSPPG